jgi:hypothetical protein
MSTIQAFKVTPVYPAILTLCEVEIYGGKQNVIIVLTLCEVSQNNRELVNQR